MTKTKAIELAELLEPNAGWSGGDSAELEAAAHLRQQDALIRELVEALVFMHTGKGKLHTPEDVAQLLTKAEAAR